MLTNYCKCCLKKNDLVKHHIKYKKYGADKDLLVSLCKDCHNFLHRFIKGKDPDLEMFTRNFIQAKKWW